jgi:hypothetical protein
MGGLVSREAFANPVCTDETIKRNIQTALEQLKEYSGYSISLVSTKTPADVPNTCDVEYNYVKAGTNATERDVRRVAFTSTGAVESVGTARSGLSYTVPRVTKQAVYDYYRILANYNQRWNMGAWRTEFSAGRLYDPPLPPWNDPIFVRNIGIYNDNLNLVLSSKGVFDMATHSSMKPETYQTMFQKYVATTPGAPNPPPLTDIQLEVGGTEEVDVSPPSFADVTGGADSATQEKNAQTNATAQQRNLYKYDTMVEGVIKRDGPDYDPPRDGDSYETVLIKFSKAYDIVAGVKSGLMDLASASTKSDLYKRFAGRGFAFPIPEPVVPLTAPLKGAMAYNYRPYEFSAREQNVIDYCPVDATSADYTLLKTNVCLSLGFHDNADASGAKFEACGAGACCVPLAPTPAYKTPVPGPARVKPAGGSAPAGYSYLNPYTDASVLADIGDTEIDYGPTSLSTTTPPRRPPPAKRTGSACAEPKEYTVRSKTFVVQSPSTRAQNAKKRFEYIVNRPTATCTDPVGTKEGFVPADPGSYMKGTQQEANSAKMALLRGMN